MVPAAMHMVLAAMHIVLAAMHMVPAAMHMVPMVHTARKTGSRRRAGYITLART